MSLIDLKTRTCSRGTSHDSHNWIDITPDHSRDPYWCPGYPTTYDPGEVHQAIISFCGSHYRDHGNHFWTDVKQGGPVSRKEKYCLGEEGWEPEPELEPQKLIPEPLHPEVPETYWDVLDELVSGLSRAARNLIRIARR